MKRMWSKNELKEISKQLIESGLIENAKPIYCHPIVIYIDDVSRTMRVTCLIFNNSATPFTLNTLKTWFDNLVASTNARARIMASGASKYTKATSDEEPTEETLIASSIDKTTGNIYTIQGIKLDGTVGAYSDADWQNLFPPLITTLIDGVNKIN